MSRVRISVKRFLTGILASAMIITGAPSYAYAEETDEFNTLVENVVQDETDKQDQVDNTEEPAVEQTEEKAAEESEQEQLEASDEDSDVLLADSDSIEVWREFQIWEYKADFLAETDNPAINMHHLGYEKYSVSPDGFTFIIRDRDKTDGYIPYATLLPIVLEPTKIEDDPYSYENAQLYTFEVSKEDMQKSSTYTDDGVVHKTLLVGAGDCMATLSSNSNFSSAVFYAYDGQSEKRNGPVDVYKGTTEFRFCKGNRVAITGLGNSVTQVPHGDFYRVTAGDNKYYGDKWLDDDGRLFMLDPIHEDTAIKIDQASLKTDAVSATGDIEADDYEVTCTFDSSFVDDGYVKNSKDNPDAKVTLAVNNTGTAKAYAIASKNATIKVGNNDAKPITLSYDNEKDSYYYLIPSGMLAEAAFLDEPSIVITADVDVAADRRISLNDKSNINSATFRAYGGSLELGPTVITKTDPKPVFLDNQRVALTGLGAGAAGRFIRVEAYNNTYYGDRFYNSDGNDQELFDLGNFYGDTDVTITAADLATSAITGYSGSYYGITCTVDAANNIGGKIDTGNKLIPDSEKKARVKLKLVNKNGTMNKTVSSAVYLELKENGEEKKCFTVLSSPGDKADEFWVDIPFYILAEAAFLNKPSIVVDLDVEDCEIYTYEPSGYPRTGFTITGATASKRCHIAGNGDVTVKYTTPTGRNFTSVKICIAKGRNSQDGTVTYTEPEELVVGGEYVTETVSGNTHTWVISKKAIDKTFDDEERGKKIYVDVTADPKKQTITFAGNGATVKSYTPPKFNKKQEYVSGDVIGDEITSAEVDYNSGIVPFVVDYDKDNYNIASVKQGSVNLTLATGSGITYTKEGSDNKTPEYYNTKPVTADAAVTVTLAPKKAETGTGFTVVDNADHAAFATTNAILNNEGKYIYKANTSELAFTVTSDISHVPVVELGHLNGTDFEAEATLSGKLTTDAKYTKRTYTYKTAATKVAGKVIRITEGVAPTKVLTVTVAPTAVLEPSVKIGNELITGTPKEGGVYEYSVPEFSTVTVSSGFKTGKSGYYKLNSITLDGKSQTAAIVNKGTVSSVVTADSNVTFTAVGLTTMFLGKDGDTEVISNNGTVALGSRDTATLQIRNGDSTEDPLALSSNDAIACVVKAGGKDVPGFATISDDRKTVTIDAKKAALLNKNPVTVTIQGDGFAKQTVKFNVDQLVSTVTATNFKFDNLSKKNIATQSAGTTATYKLTLGPKSAPVDNVHIKYVTGSDPDGQVFLATETNGSKVLSVATFKDDRIATKPLMVQFYDDAGTPSESDDIDIGSPFVVTPSAKFAASTVKLQSATDIGMKLSLAAPKGLDQYKNLYYEVKATPVSPVSGRMNEEGLTVQEPITATEIELILAKGIENEGQPVLGEGAAQKYDVNVKIVQLINNNEVEADKFKPANIFKPDAGAVRSLSASTKAPYYETNLSLTKKTTTFTQGEKTPGFEASGLYVAVAKFSGATTFASVDTTRSYVADADGNKIDGANVLVGADGVSLWIDDTSVIPVGKATLVVAPIAPEGAQYKLATVPLTVKAPIDKIWVFQSGSMLNGVGTILYKKSGTAASMKFTSNALWDGDDDDNDSWFKPASTKVTWSLTAPVGSALLNNNNATVNTSNGTVTISKDYVPSGNPSLDQFTVTASAADFTGNTTVSGSMTVNLTATAIKINSAKVVNDNNQKVDVSNSAPDDLIGKTVKFYDENDQWINPFNLTFKVSPAGLTLDPMGIIRSVTKAGTFTVTATSLDGGKSSFATTITNAGLTIGSSKVFVWDAIANSGAGGYVEADTTGLIDPGSYGYVQFYDAKGNDIPYSELDIKSSAGMTLTLYPNSPDAAFFTSVKQPGTYKVTATTKDGGRKKIEKNITFGGSTEGYEVEGFTYSTGNDNAAVFNDMPHVLTNGTQEATVNNTNALSIEVYRADSGIYPYNATLTVTGGTIITNTTGTIVENGGRVRQGGKYVIKPTKEMVEIAVKGGGKSATYKINVKTGTRKALAVNKLVKTEFIGSTTAAYNKSFTFDTSEFTADGVTPGRYRLVFTPNEAYHKVKTDAEKYAYDTLSVLLNTAGAATVATKMTPDSGAVFTTATRTDYGTVPVGSYKFDVTVVEVKDADGNDHVNPQTLTKPLTVTFKANAPKKISAKLNNSGKVTIKDTANTTAQIPFAANSAYSSIVNAGAAKPVLYNNNDKGVVNSFTKYFDVTVSSNQLVLTRKSGAGAEYNWTEAENKKGEATIVGWVGYTVVGEDGTSTLSYCEKVTVTLKK